MQMHKSKEMSKQKDSKHNLPNVVAKLMGLNTLPRGEPNLSVERCHIMYGPIGLPFKHWQQEFMDRKMLHEVHPNTEQVAYRDMYEIWQQSQRASYVRDKVPDRGRFMEAKRMSTDERMRRSKQFKDALEVLSSNSDLLIRLLDSQNVYEFYSSPPNESKRITLIKPLKIVDTDKSTRKEKNNNRLIKKPESVDHANPGYSPVSQKVDESPVRTTRIVLLKPSPGRTPEQKAVVSPTTSSPLNLKSGNFNQGPEYDDVLESIRVAKEIPRQMHKGRRSYAKDKTPYSTVFSNGSSDDESSFNKSYHEYAFANFSDLEAMSMSQLPRLSWDYSYVNGRGSPNSTMSLGRVPWSPESSVGREAKERLSERWTMMTSDNTSHQEQKNVRSSTLGEMLSLTHIKKSATSEVESFNEDQEPGLSVFCSHSFNAEISIKSSPKNLPRSSSVPASSTTELTIAVNDHNAAKAQGSKARTKSKSMRSSLRGKVASFLFSKSKKSTKEKPRPSQSKYKSQSIATETLVLPANSPEILTDDVSQDINVDGFEEYSLAALSVSSGKTSTDLVSNREEDMITLEPGLIVPLPKPVGLDINSSDNQDQPSPISVLQPPFEDYNNNAYHGFLDSIKSGQLGLQVPLKSNLIDKSPPIESIARTLSWDDSCAEVASPYPLKPSIVSSLDSKVEDQEWLLLVHKLLSATGLDNQRQYDSIYTRWYSLENPLDPSLRDTLYANLNEKEPQPMDESRRRKVRSNHKLVFDYVNAALLELVGYGREKCLKSSGSHCRVLVQEGASASPLLVDHIVAQMKELITRRMRCEGEDGGDSISLVVENVVSKEVVQIGWVELMQLEIDILGKEIEGDLIEELVENAVVDFTGRS